MLKQANALRNSRCRTRRGKDRSLTELLSSGAIVLYFYPADFTPGCTRQACALRDLHDDMIRRPACAWSGSARRARNRMRNSGQIQSALRPAVG